MFAYKAIGALIQDLFGTATTFAGLACTPTTPAGMNVQVGLGRAFSYQPVDNVGYSSLGQDTTDSIMKQGILSAAQTLACAAPGTSGMSINYLVCATFTEQDINPVVLPYYNSLNPSQAFSGPPNSGQSSNTPQNTKRQDTITVQAVAGIPATTGTQTTPAAPSGYTPLYVVTVAYGQSTITAANIVQVNGAPILPASLITIIQASLSTSAMDTGAANAYAAAYAPTITALYNNMTLLFEAKNANTGASTFAPNGMTAYPILGGDHQALTGGEIVAGGKCEVIWKASANSWILLGCTGGYSKTATPPQNDNSNKVATTAWGNGIASHGQCRLSVTNATTLTLMPYNGRNIIINGTVQQIPSAGVTATPGGSGSTLYYVYAWMNAGVMALAFSPTGHSTAPNGVETMTGDVTKTLVGMVYTNASGQYVDSVTQRFCLNWFNRRMLTATASAMGSTSSTTFVELTTSLRVQMLCWADESVTGGATGNMAQNTAIGTSSAFIGLLIDGANSGIQTNMTSMGANYVIPSAVCSSFALAEGMHTLSLGGAVSGTATLTVNVYSNAYITKG